MIQTNSIINSPVRHIKAKAELYNGLALANTYTDTSDLVSISIERVGEESKFFGFGICQRLNINLIDIARAKSITTANSFKIYFNANESGYISNFPRFNVTETNRDEKTNQLSITAYDAIKKSEEFVVARLLAELPTSYTILDFAAGAATLLGLDGVEVPSNSSSFNLSYADGANFEGIETLREALNAVAEATQTIYFINYDNKLVFKMFDKDGGADLTITKADYIELESKTNRKLQTITNTTELGDEVSASITEIGTTQYIRDNPFLELREDIAAILDDALAAIGGITINQFYCSWRGNYLLEIGDKIELITKDGGSAFSYVINDTINYNGAYEQATSWSYADGESQTATNPTTLGEVLKQTYAKIDKANKTIDIVASEASANAEALAALQVNTESITGTVSKLQEELDSAGETISTLNQKVEAQLTETDITIKIQSELANGVDKVTTGKGYKLDDEGLTIEDLNPNSNNKITTTVSNNGMLVESNDNEVLRANDEGVKAQDLHATTFLIIGNTSRLEDYNGRTACFWIGG